MWCRILGHKTEGNMTLEGSGVLISHECTRCGKFDWWRKG
jgi:hypothetical protein